MTNENVRSKLIDVRNGNEYEEPKKREEKVFHGA